MPTKKSNTSKRATTKSRPAASSVPSEELVTGGPSPTAVAAESYRTGVAPDPAGPRRHLEIPREAEILGGDDDSNVLNNEYVGDEAPAGHMLTPDHDRVDDIGRAMGVQEADSGALVSTSELLDRRDQHRAQQDIPDPSTREDQERRGRDR